MDSIVAPTRRFLIMSQGNTKPIRMFVQPWPQRLAAGSSAPSVPKLSQRWRHISYGRSRGRVLTGRGTEQGQPFLEDDSA